MLDWVTWECRLAWSHATLMEHFYYLKIQVFLRFKPVLFVCFHLYHSIISTSLYYVPLDHDSKQCFHGQGAIVSSITVPCCPHGIVASRNVTGLQLIYLYIWWLPIYFRPPPSVFTIVHCVCVFPGDAASHWVDIYGLTGGVMNCGKLLLVSVRVTVSD